MPGLQKGRPHRLTPGRMAEIAKWRTLGAQARRGRHIALRQSYHKKRAKRGSSAIGAIAKSAAWGTQKMVVPVGLGGPFVALAKNRLPGYNQFQIAKASGHRASTPTKSPLRRR